VPRLLAVSDIHGNVRAVRRLPARESNNFDAVRRAASCSSIFFSTAARQSWPQANRTTQSDRQTAVNATFHWEPKERRSALVRRPGTSIAGNRQRMNDTACAPNEDLAIDDGWLRERGHIAIEPERPLQLRATQLVHAQSTASAD
jgi:hypothetical protein